MVKKLSDLLEVTDVLGNSVDINTEITGLVIDSRKVKPGDLFIAIKGGQSDGHKYLNQALENGAVAVLVTDGRSEVESEMISLRWEDGLLGKLANVYYDYPSENLTVIGITGTNGKTTVGTILYQAIVASGAKCGLISTVKIIIGEEEFPSELTTPDVLTLHRIHFEMLQAGCSYVIMEVSSHAIHQKRIEGIEFDCGIFTNITHDHLDYHKDFSEYLRVKKMFFDSLEPEAVAITNTDDKNGEVMLQNTKAKKVSYALKHGSDYKGKILSSTLEGLHLEFNSREALFRLAGNFNAYNLLAAYACLVELNVGSKEEMLTYLTQVTPPEGRLDVIRVLSKNALAIVDYAHTPDALANVLKTIKQMTSGKVVTVIGCGGDRDKTKRPKMAAIAAHFSDQVILTSDNPRTENPETILDEMEVGITSEDDHRVFRMTQREKAIKMGVMLVEAGDVLLVAGKGHEKYQEVNGVRTPFDDKRKIMEFSIR